MKRRTNGGPFPQCALYDTANKGIQLPAKTGVNATNLRLNETQDSRKAGKHQIYTGS